MSSRDALRQDFIAAAGWADATVTALPGDASFRYIWLPEAYCAGLGVAGGEKMGLVN